MYLKERNVFHFYVQKQNCSTLKNRSGFKVCCTCGWQDLLTKENPSNKKLLQQILIPKVHFKTTTVCRTVRLPCDPEICTQCQDLVAWRPCGYPTNYLILLNHLQNKGRQTTDVSQMLGFLTSQAGCGGQKVQLSALQFNYTEPYFLCSTPSLVKRAQYFVTSYFDRLGSLVVFCFVLFLF